MSGSNIAIIFCLQFNQRVYHEPFSKKLMFYSFELILAGIILLTVMTACVISLWLKRRNEKIEQLKQAENEEQNNQNSP